MCQLHPSSTYHFSSEVATTSRPLQWQEECHIWHIVKVVALESFSMKPRASSTVLDLSMDYTLFQFLP